MPFIDMMPDSVKLKLEVDFNLSEEVVDFLMNKSN
jgi:hypothetical protein